MKSSKSCTEKCRSMRNARYPAMTPAGPAAHIPVISPDAGSAKIFASPVSRTAPTSRSAGQARVGQAMRSPRHRFRRKQARGRDRSPVGSGSNPCAALFPECCPQPRSLRAGRPALKMALLPRPRKHISQGTLVCIRSLTRISPPGPLSIPLAMPELGTRPVASSAVFAGDRFPPPPSGTGLPW